MYENLFSVLQKNFPSDETTFIRTGNGRVISYGDMLKRTAQFANALVERGVKPGDSVATQVGKNCASNSRTLFRIKTPVSPWCQSHICVHVW